jgi:predicted XRE-type DNA-binding protein
MQLTITPEYLASQGLSPTFEKRFWEKVFIMPYDRGCWLWVAYTDPNGYGQMGSIGRKLIRSHVASWVLTFGPVPKGKCVCHTCDNPPCCNPSHLWLGTKDENFDDMRRKGRVAKGETHTRAKLTSNEVFEIRNLYQRGGVFQREIADLFGVSRMAVSAIVCGYNWKHLKDTPNLDTAGAGRFERTV